MHFGALVAPVLLSMGLTTTVMIVAHEDKIRTECEEASMEVLTTCLEYKSYEGMEEWLVPREMGEGTYVVGKAVTCKQPQEVKRALDVNLYFKCVEGKRYDFF